MQSRNIGYVPQIDQLRLLAALIVFGFHFFHIYRGGWQPYPQLPWFGLITEGHTGVSLFFGLSGFIFMLIAMGGEAIDYRAFLRNRLLRIAPLYLTVFFVAISVGRDRFEATDLVYLLVSNIGDPPTSWFIITGPAWSISIEFTFYLVFPFLALFTRERGARYLIQLIALMLMIRIGAYAAAEKSQLLFYSTLVGRFDQFLIGMLAAMLYHHHQDRLRAHATVVLAIASVIVLLVIGVQAANFSYFLPDAKRAAWAIWGPIEATAWAFLIAAFVAARPSVSRRVDGWLATAGSWSFSIYMWHALILYSAHTLIGPIAGTGLFGLALNGLLLLAATLGFAWLSFVTIEKPFLGLRRRYVEKPAGEPDRI